MYAMGQSPQYRILAISMTLLIDQAKEEPACDDCLQEVREEREGGGGICVASQKILFTTLRNFIQEGRASNPDRVSRLRL